MRLPFFGIKRTWFSFRRYAYDDTRAGWKINGCISYWILLAHKVGEWKATKKAIIIKRHRDSDRPQNSFFRYGFDFIRDLLVNPCNKLAQFKTILNVSFNFYTQQELASWFLSCAKIFFILVKIVNILLSFVK